MAAAVAAAGPDEGDGRRSADSGAEQEYESLVRRTLTALCECCQDPPPGTRMTRDMRLCADMSRFTLEESPQELELLMRESLRKPPKKAVIPHWLARQGVQGIQRRMLKMLVTTLTFDPPEEVLVLFDQLLSAELARSTVTQVEDLVSKCPGSKHRVAVWRGDTALLNCDAIVNACNDRMLGCMRPNHPCIDNAIHCGAGPRLRRSCREFMAASDFAPEPTGMARVTPGYSLPCKWVLHTVGPIADYKGHEQPRLLSSCYRTCLDAAKERGCRSISFCCLSTGVFGYPPVAACQVALRTTAAWLSANPECSMDVVFNVFKREDLVIYAEQAPKLFPGVQFCDSLGDYDPAST
eukprot:TRINITY_DN4332_c1_g1_i1.p1 TRINITY_DN4332_c1_g1~~TRINITY_DN4332_c1_g1_i1.p1  ORF type:complete len:377 (+),score=63.83 TRINITY_DN4332_c1_g1_i1:78-1133(+)